MIEIKVGEEFPLTRVEEGGMIDLKENGFIAFIGMKDIREEEIEKFKKNNINLDLSIVEDIMFFVLEIEGVILSDMPFNVDLIRADIPVKELIKRNYGIYTLTLFLVDTRKNILKSIRVIGLSKEFSEVLEEQMSSRTNNISNNSFIKSDYDRKLGEIFKSFTIDGIKKLSIIRHSSK